MHKYFSNISLGTIGTSLYLILEIKEYSAMYFLSVFDVYMYIKRDTSSPVQVHFP